MQDENLTYNLDNIIGYCKSCKEPILISEDYVKEHNKLYCLYCYKTEHDIHEELDFG